MCEYGGMYMDVDTIPHNPATIFLMKPEVPDYFQRNADDREERRHVSWMNLFLDETGMLIARKNDAALRVNGRDDGRVPGVRRRFVLPRRHEGARRCV
jgi:hypothetical protein